MAYRTTWIRPPARRLALVGACRCGAVLFGGAAMASGADGGAKTTPEILNAVKSHFVDPAAWSDGQLDEAILAGLTQKLGPGIEVVPDPEPAPDGPALYTETVEGTVLYMRIHRLGDPGLAAEIQAAVKTVADDKAKVQMPVVLDLRGLADFENFGPASAVLSLLLPPGMTLYSLQDKAGKIESFKTGGAYHNTRVPVAILIGPGTQGAPEALAHALRETGRAVAVGAPTAGKSVVFFETPLPDKRRLRVASKKCLKQDGSPLFPNPVTPDVEAAAAPDQEAAVAERIKKNAPMSELVKEPKALERQSEAALVRGENPEIDLYREEQRGRGEKTQNQPRISDPALTAALDIFRAVAAMDLKPVWQPAPPRDTRSAHDDRKTRDEKIPPPAPGVMP